MFWLPWRPSIAFQWLINRCHQLRQRGTCKVPLSRRREFRLINHRNAIRYTNGFQFMNKIEAKSNRLREGHSESLCWRQKPSPNLISGMESMASLDDIPVVKQLLPQYMTERDFNSPSLKVLASASILFMFWLPWRPSIAFQWLINRCHQLRQRGTCKVPLSRRREFRLINHRNAIRYTNGFQFMNKLRLSLIA